MNIIIWVFKGRILKIVHKTYGFLTIYYFFKLNSLNTKNKKFLIRQFFMKNLHKNMYNTYKTSV